MVVTLSPCVRETSSTRVGPSCLERLRASGIERLHFGALDTHQAKNPRRYETAGLCVTETRAPGLQQACEALHRIFREHGPRINHELVHIKAQATRDVFGPLRATQAAPAT